jgi:hypothetical protein
MIWTPQPTQFDFQSRWEDEAFYGGAAGGGKSDALLTEALRQVSIEGYKGIIFRRTYPDLTELIDRSQYLYKKAYPKAKFNANAHVWRFPSGAKIYFGNINSTFKTDYQGKAFDFIGFDELTHFTLDQYMYLFSRNRPTVSGLRSYIRATGNPGGIGHGWVKDRFITAAPPKTTIWTNIDINTPAGEVIHQRKSRIFIPSSVFDNKILMSNDPGYIGRLAMMPEAERNALLYGDWNSFTGQVFTEWRDEPTHYDDHKLTHVINPFIVPKTWPIYRGFDYGYSRPFSVGWYTQSTEGRIYRIAEYYGCTGTPNEGIRIEPRRIAQEIRRIENEDINLKGRKIVRAIADPAIFQRTTGESIADMMEDSPNFIHWDTGDNTRIAGKMQMHYRMAFGEDDKPLFYVFNTCKHFIRTIPNLIYSEKYVEDIDTDMEDHIYDECRYVLMDNPIAPRMNKLAPPIPQEDPLRMYKNIKPYGY